MSSLDARVQQDSAQLVEVVDSLGIATGLLAADGHLKPHNCWMGINTNPRTYTDELVLGFAKWASAHSDKFLLLITSRMQLYNKIPFSGKRWEKFGSDEYVRPASKRKRDLKKLVGQQGLENVEVKLLEDELMPELEASSGHAAFMINYGYQFLSQLRQSDAALDAAIMQVTRGKVGHLLEKARMAGVPEQFALNALSYYAHDEIFTSLVLAQLGVATVKIGPAWEKPYDIVTKDIIDDKYGLFANEGTEFGAVYLAPKEKGRGD